MTASVELFLLMVFSRVQIPYNKPDLSSCQRPFQRDQIAILDPAHLFNVSLRVSLG